MPDFGHDLQFATFPEPLANRALEPAELAVLSEEQGYDLVMFQDHPYRPDYLDVWTLMSWAAAWTTRIHVAPNVLNMGMRSPALVARSAASIDRMSGGRFELGLGAGLLWDQMTAMGAPRRTHGQAITALSEAVDIIRAAWNTDAGPVLAGGSYHHVDGMLPGPPPAHDIPVWLGAYKPRMLALAGRKADGWAAMLGRVQTRAQWQAASAIVDEAAAGAGRDPAAIRRIAGIAGSFTRAGRGSPQGPPAQWAEQLLPSVVEDGVGTFILVTNDRTAIQRFAEEVIPALRAAVAAERGDPAVS